MTRALVAIGGNVGAVADTLARAVRALEETPEVRVTATSALYRTRPVGGPPGQPDFLNGALALETTLEPTPLMERLLAIELALGRRREVVDGPRTVDLDLILYGERVVKEPKVTVPHPRMHQRGFVLVPLADVAPDATHPLLGKTVRELRDALGPDLGMDPAPVPFDPLGQSAPKETAR